MNARRIVFAGLVAISAVASTGTARAALIEVHLGSTYYEDATVGDGKIEVRQGGQIQFITDDSGTGGRPHTVEVDELGIHSGSLTTGQTYTTPAIQQAGTFKLYCKFHENAGHWTTLVVLSNATATTTTAAPITTTTSASSASKSTATTSASGTPTDGSGTSTATSIAAADTALAPTGLGQASDETMGAVPVNPRSLEAVLGRPPATRGPWTRSVRMALLGLLPLWAATGVALARFARGPLNVTHYRPLRR